LCVATVNSLVVLRLLSGSASLQALEPAQLHALAALALSSQGLAMNVAFVLLGLGSTVFSYLWLKSGYVPTWLAWLGIVASLLLGPGTLLIMVFPGLSVIGLTYMVPMFFYEVGLGLWLVTKGLGTSPAEVA